MTVTTQPATGSAYKGGILNPIGLTMFKAPKEGACGIPVQIQWSTYPDANDPDGNPAEKAVAFDLSQLGQKFSQIGGLYVDNLHCSVEIGFYFPDTQTWYQIAPRMSGFIPVATSALRFTAQTLSYPITNDVTNFTILNVFAPPEQVGLQQMIIAGQPVTVDFGGNPQPVSVQGQPIQTTFGGVTQPVGFGGVSQPVNLTVDAAVHFASAQPVSFAGVSQPVNITGQPVQVNFGGIAQPVGFGGIAQPVTIGSQPIQVKPEDLTPNNINNGAPGNIGITNYVLFGVGVGTKIYGLCGCMNLFANGGAQTIATIRLADNGRILWSYSLTFAPGAGSIIVPFANYFTSPVLRQTAGQTILQWQVIVGAIAVGGWNFDFSLLSY